VYYTTGRFVTGRACCGLDVFGYGGWVGREEVLCEIRWNALKKVRVLRDAGESIILFFIIIIIIIIISIIFFFMYGYSEPVSLSCVQCARGHRPK